MSTFCTRIYEYMDESGKWVRADKCCDNLYVFDTWHNPDYCDRGLPNDCTVTQDELMDMIGNDKRDITWGKSYIYGNELYNLINKELDEASRYIYRETCNTQLGMVLKKLDKQPIDIDETLTQEQFHEMFCESLDAHNMLCSELVGLSVATRIASKNDEHIHFDKMRIVYWFE